MKEKKGFTLVELLAVIAILAILVIMALPAVLRMFNNARKDSFTNEVNTVIRAARQQYLLSGGTDTEWSNASGSSNSLDLTGSSSLQYYVQMNNEGKITKLQVSNGDFQYNKTGIIDVAESSDVQEVTEENQLIITSNGSGESSSSLTYVNRQNAGSITVGDEVAIDTEHFYVVSSNSTNTVLLAKYSLLVGDVFNYNYSSFTLSKTMNSSNTTGYGLQSSTAKGLVDTDAPIIGAVPFSGTNYWDNSVCQYTGTTWGCTGTSGLKSEYATNGSYSGSPYPNVYNSSLSSTSPSINYNNGYGLAQNNGYTISYYVENYVNTLKSLGAPSSITGRLLTYEEARSLVSSNSSIVYNYSLYWLGSVYGDIDVWYVNSSTPSEGWEGYDRFNDGSLYAIEPRSVRPVIEIPTSEMPN